jgi:hypothetical protein
VRQTPYCARNAQDLLAKTSRCSYPSRYEHAGVRCPRCCSKKSGRDHLSGTWARMAILQEARLHVTSENLQKANFGERRKAEVQLLRIPLPGTSVNKDRQKLQLYSLPEKPYEPPSSRGLTNGYKCVTSSCIHRRVCYDDYVQFALTAGTAGPSVEGG